MKLLTGNLSKIRLVQTTTIAFCGLLAVSGIQAQTINDDLQPNKPKTTTTRPKNPKTIKPKPPVKRPIVRPVYRPPVAPPIAVQMQSPADIMARYMNFQQSSSVTAADWESIVKQTSGSSDKTAKAQLAIAQGQLAFNRNDYSNALIQYNAAAQFLPESALPFYGIGRVYLNTRQPNEAENAFEKAIKLNKNFALAYKGLGDAMSAQGKTKKAQEYYKQAARIGVAGNSANRPANTPNVPNGAPVNPTNVPPESAFDRELKSARVLTAQKKWNMSLSKLQPLTATNPSADLYILIGDNYYGMEAWLSAQQAYRKATEINPNSANAFYKSGMVLFETNEFQSAADAFEKSLILDQNGTTINRLQVRKMADKAREKAKDAGKDKKKGLFGLRLM